MTDRDYDTYQFIVSYIKENGYPPTVKEIGFGIGVTSTNTAYYRLAKLERDGWIETMPASPRAIKVIGYEFRKKEDDVMCDTNTESLAIKAEIKQKLIKEIGSNVSEDDMNAILKAFDDVSSRYRFSRKK